MSSDQQLADETPAKPIVFYVVGVGDKGEKIDLACAPTSKDAAAHYKQLAETHGGRLAIEPREETIRVHPDTKLQVFPPLEWAVPKAPSP